MIHWLKARDLAALQRFAQVSEVPLSAEPVGPRSWVALQPGAALPRVRAGEELLVLWDGGPLSLELAAAIEAADRVLCLEGADPALPQALTSAPVMGLERWAEGCPRRHHQRSQATWERVLRGEDAVSAALLHTSLPLDPSKLQDALGAYEGLRVAGFGWSTEHPDAVLHLSWTQQGWSLSRAGTWWIGTRRSHWPTDPAHLERIQAQWHPDFGDRITQLVAIGAALEIQALVHHPQGWEGAARLPW